MPKWRGNLLFEVNEAVLSIAFSCLTPDHISEQNGTITEITSDSVSSCKAAGWLSSALPFLWLCPPFPPSLSWSPRPWQFNWQSSHWEAGRFISIVFLKCCTWKAGHGKVSWIQPEAGNPPIPVKAQPLSHVLTKERLAGLFKRPAAQKDIHTHPTIPPSNLPRYAHFALPPSLPPNNSQWCVLSFTLPFFSMNKAW